LRLFRHTVTTIRKYLKMPSLPSDLTTSDHLKSLDEVGLRLSLFRLYPDQDFEDDLIESFSKRLGENVAFFKIFGAYDIACIYPSYIDHKMLYSGSILGIRSFSNLDCICWKDSTHSDILSDIKNRDVLSITSFSINQDDLQNMGGIRPDYLLNLSKDIGFYLNAFSSGEQILIIPGQSMAEIISKGEEFFKKIDKYLYRIHSLYGVNFNFVKDIDIKGNKIWTEEINDELSLLWEVDLAPKQNVEYDFRSILTDSFAKFRYKLIATNFKTSLEKVDFYCEFKDGSWGEMTKAIRQIRKDSKDLILSTKLHIFKHYN